MARGPICFRWGQVGGERVGGGRVGGGWEVVRWGWCGRLVSITGRACIIFSVFDCTVS